MNKSNETRFLIVRLIVFGLLIAIQMAWILVIIEGLLSYSVLLNIILSLLSFLIILYLLNKDDSPAYRMSWIILIALFPLLGSLFYLFAGNKRPLKEMTRRIQNQVENHREDRQTVPDALPILKHRSNRLSSIAKYVSDFAGMPVLVNQEVDYYPNGESVMDDLVADLKAAKSHIFLEFFIIEEGQMYNQIFDVLKQKAKEGVDVRLIYDDFGCLLRLNDSFVEDMARYGIKALKFNPVRPIVSLVYNTRDHRKYIIIDNEVAYTGGVNIADEYINRKNRFGYWKDTMIRVKGGAVWNYAHMFLLLWNAYKNEDFDFTNVVVEDLFEDQVDFETFSKSDFRAVKVLDCKEVPKSKKLLEFTLDDGSGKNRTILSGIKAYYSAEELVGKTLLAITNLPPRKMMGINSEGMILSAIHEKDGQEQLNLIILKNNIPAGAKVY